jgi:CBS domain-containing protein
MSIGEACNRNVVSARAGTSIAEAAAMMRREHVGDVVVVEPRNGADVPIGIVTDRDIVIEVVAAGINPAAVTLGDLLPHRLEAIDERETAADAIRRMSAEGVRRLPVVDLGGTLVGIVTVDDLLPHIATQLAALAEVAKRGRSLETSVRR